MSTRPRREQLLSRRRRRNTPAGARRKREEERGGPGDRGGGLSAELKYDPAVRSHSATTVTMRLTKRPYTLRQRFRALPPHHLSYTLLLFLSLCYKIVSCYSIADVIPTAYTNQRCTNKTLCVTCVLGEVVPRFCRTLLLIHCSFFTSSIIKFLFFAINILSIAVLHC